MTVTQPARLAPFRAYWFWMIPLWMGSVLWAQPSPLFVSPQGDDANPGTREKPWATIHRAKAAAVQLKAAGQMSPEGLTIFLREGVYVLDRPLMFKPEDSGEPNAPITYAAYEDEGVTLSGGISVNGWKPYQGHIYQADLSARPVTPFRQLYFNETLQPCARVPNVDPRQPRTGGCTFTTAPADPNHRDILHYDPNIIHPTQWKHPEKALVDIFCYPDYGNQVLRVTGVNEGQNTLLVEKPGREASSLEGDRFYVKNVFEELDAPGEWYFDDEKQMLYFWPPDSQAPQDQQVIIPVIDTLVHLQGTADHLVSGIRFEKIHFAHTRNMALFMEAAQDCQVRGCRVQNVGGAGMEMRLDCRRNQIVSNDVIGTGHIGIRLIGKVFEHERVSGNLIANNYITDVGRECCMEVAGIYMTAAGHNTAAHNLIHNTPRWGIGMNVGNDNIIEYNHVYDTNYATEDAGGINYVTSWAGWENHFDPNHNDHVCGNIFRHNLVHDTGGYGRVKWWTDYTGLKQGTWRTPYFSFGIYLDLATSGSQVYGNIIYNTPNGGIVLGGGEDNICENNIIIGGEVSQIYAVKWCDHFPMARNRVERNILVHSDPRSFLYWYTQQGQCPWQPGDVFFDNNLIWNPCQEEMRLMIGDQGIRSWDWFKTQGMDQHSILADPRFVDPEHHDYRLKEESPAFKLGFKPIPVEKIGLYKDPLYRNTLPPR